tara:strand:+ start:541 stop:1086 length:546 start_codon:yes stop_codon:yes gene_type:complete
VPAQPRGRRIALRAYRLPPPRAQILFLAGVVMIIGAQKTFRFFFQKRKIKGTSCFLGGIGLVLLGWPVIGMGVEGFGFLNLFGDFFPIALGFMRNMPIIGTLLNLPAIRAVRSATAHIRAPHAPPRARPITRCRRRARAATGTPSHTPSQTPSHTPNHTPRAGTWRSQVTDRFVTKSRLPV